MDLWTLPVNFFVALFALIDPVGNVPVFAAATSAAEPAGRRRLAAYIAAFIFVFLVFFYFTGLSLLQFFGISMPAFRIAGGVILFLLGLEMLRGDFGARFTDPIVEGQARPSVRDYARKRFESLVVPFAMPLLIGPGCISTVIIYASESQGRGLLASGLNVFAIFMVAILVMVCFWLTPLISRILGRIGMTIVVRVLGLILCAMAVQFVLIGVADSTHGLILREAAAPYSK
ncbi:MAG: MarC family protein [Caulobacteraceae bacterium]|nr:MAG: MarC family protein [Caulobacteraceae bacterium]